MSFYDQLAGGITSVDVPPSTATVHYGNWTGGLALPMPECSTLETLNTIDKYLAIGGAVVGAISLAPVEVSGLTIVSVALGISSILVEEREREVANKPFFSADNLSNLGINLMNH